jgi:MerR HTH family regulatory protein
MIITTAAAKAVGISRKTLQGWMARGWFDPPIMQIRDGHAVRLWSARDIARLRRYVKNNFLNKSGREPFRAAIRGRAKRGKRK